MAAAAAAAAATAAAVAMVAAAVAAVVATMAAAAASAAPPLESAVGQLVVAVKAEAPWGSVVVEPVVVATVAVA